MHVFALGADDDGAMQATELWKVDTKLARNSLTAIKLSPGKHNIIWTEWPYFDKFVYNLSTMAYNLYCTF